MKRFNELSCAFGYRTMAVLVMVVLIPVGILLFADTGNCRSPETSSEQALIHRDTVPRTGFYDECFCYVEFERCCQRAIFLTYKLHRPPICVPVMPSTHCLKKYLRCVRKCRMRRNFRVPSFFRDSIVLPKYKLPDSLIEDGIYKTPQYIDPPFKNPNPDVEILQYEPGSNSQPSSI